MLKLYLRTWPARYELLDGLRGLACLGVLLHHLRIIELGHYCVMIFFVISGYCIGASAQSALRQGMSFGSYMLRRARRIYAPYLLAVAFFAATRLFKVALGRAPSWHPSISDWIQNLTLTQWFSVLLHPVHWPADNRKLFVAAFWSLNYEEQFYLIIGLGIVLAARRYASLATSVLVLLLLGLAWDVTHPGGPLIGLFLEYWPHFALGCCLYFVLCEHPSGVARTLFIGCTLLLGLFSLSQVLPWHAEVTENGRRVYVELTLLSGVSLALFLLRPFSESISRNLLWRPIAAVGAISYSLYLIHQFNLTLVGETVHALLPVTAPATAIVALNVALHLSLASCFWFLFERPFLSRRPLGSERAVAKVLQARPATQANP